MAIFSLIPANSAQIWYALPIGLLAGFVYIFYCLYQARTRFRSMRDEYGIVRLQSNSPTMASYFINSRVAYASSLISLRSPHPRWQGHV
jgi:hypothetical protein